MRVYIVDDEEHARENLKRKLGTLGFDVTFCGEASNVEEAVAALETLEVDLLFLDIEMPGADGFDLLDRFETMPSMVIFVTAYNDFALRAFDYFTIGYVTKPIDNELLKKAVQKAFDSKEKEDNRIREVIRSIQMNEVSKVVIPSSKGFEVVAADEVVVIEAGEGYTTVQLQDGSKQVSSKRLKEYEDMLAAMGFLRVHRSFLINYEYIASYKKNGSITLSTGQVIQINKNSRKNVADMIKAYFDSKITS